MSDGKIVQHSKSEKFMIKTYLNKFIEQEVVKRRDQGIKTTKGDIIEDVADYAGVSTNSIERLRRLGVPMLPTAVKIAEYFNVNIEDIWEIEDNPMWEDSRKKCKKCGKTHYVLGLCYKCYSRSDKIKNYNRHN